VWHPEGGVLPDIVAAEEEVEVDALAPSRASQATHGSLDLQADLQDFLGLRTVSILRPDS